MRLAWASTWRSAVGLATGYVTIQAAGLVYAQVSAPAAAAEVLLALRIYDGIKLFASAPFYSQVPRFSVLYSQDRGTELVALARRRTELTVAVLVTVGLCVALLGNTMLAFIGSETLFPSTLFLLVLTAAYAVERVSNQQMQVQSVTNRIIWHTANLLAGLSFVVVAVSIWPLAEHLSLPIAFFISFALVQLPYVWSTTPRDLRLLSGVRQCPA